MNEPVNARPGHQEFQTAIRVVLDKYQKSPTHPYYVIADIANKIFTAEPGDDDLGEHKTLQAAMFNTAKRYAEKLWSAESPSEIDGSIKTITDYMESRYKNVLESGSRLNVEVAGTQATRSSGFALFKR